MKVFIYSKKTSKKITTILRVMSVEEHRDTITFVTESGERVSFNTHEVKSTAYQN